jgi:hypothetical protein
VIRTHIFLNHLLSSVVVIIKYPGSIVNRFFGYAGVRARDGTKKGSCPALLLSFAPWLQPGGLTLTIGEETV